MDLAEHLKTLRKQAKMTQTQVAKAIEISQQGYAYWEQGKKRPSYDNLRSRIALQNHIRRYE